MSRVLSIILMSILVGLFALSCESSSDDGTGPVGDSPIPTKLISGMLKLNPNGTVQPSDLSVFSLVASADLNADGSFEVAVPVSDKFQILYFLMKSNGNPVYMGIYDPVNETVMASDSSTVAALSFFNPYLVYTDQNDRVDFYDAIKNQNKYTELITKLNEAYESNSSEALLYDKNPNMYQLAVQLIKEVLQSQMAGSKLAKASQASDPPMIEDVSGPGIKFVNPRHIWYAAGIHPNEGARTATVNVDRIENVNAIYWGWPPVYSAVSSETDYELGDGYFRIDITKGGDFTKINQWDDPVGRATISNAAQSVVYLLDLIVGTDAYFNPDMVQTFPQHFQLTTEQQHGLANNVGSKDIEAYLLTFSEAVLANVDNLSQWIWQSNAPDPTKLYFSSLTKMFTNAALVFKLLGAVNENGPFFWDLVLAPRDVSYFVTQTNGTIVSTTKNDPPQAEFSINPPAGIIGTSFTFNASQTTDDIDALAALSFRWDWNSDGTWDTGWSSDTVGEFTFTESGAYLVTLEVKDSGGLVGAVSHTVNIGGGAGTANHVKLFRDNLPWSSNSMVTMLESLGFTEGIGPNTYEIVPSTDMPTVDLISGQDLVIISNDQNQTFYNNYAASQVRFTNFVYMGGSLFWEACDQGWAAGSMANAGIILPGNLTTDFDYDYHNYVTDDNLPLVSGLPADMDHNYASHESFGNLPDGTTVYCHNEEQEATLIEFNLGGGWIVITGQPLEHQYDNIYGGADMEQLLPRIVAHFTGKSLPKMLPKRTLKPSSRASSK